MLIARLFHECSVRQIQGINRAAVYAYPALSGASRKFTTLCVAVDNEEDGALGTRFL